jgi:pilus assembly protein CpaB
LAIDQAVDEKAKNESSKASVIGKTATLELEPWQAKILADAEAAGTLSLALRSAADNDDYHNRHAGRIIRGSEIKEF